MYDSALTLQPQYYLSITYIFFFNDTATTEIYTLSLHDALPISVILAVPLSLLGPMAVLTGLRIENNLYTQIGIILLIALSAKNAILIVEVALELHVRDRKPLLESAIEAARARFRPILMTSFAFILGVVPLVLATGAGASARKSIG